MKFFLSSASVTSTDQNLAPTYLADVVETSHGLQVMSVTLNRTSIDATGQRLLDNGDVHPGWIAWWVSLACRILDEHSDKGVWLATIRRHSFRGGVEVATVEPLMISDLLTVLGTDTGLVLWGVDSVSSKLSLSRRISCAGFVAPSLDGKVATIAASVEDWIKLRAWSAGNWGIFLDAE